MGLELWPARPAWTVDRRTGSEDIDRAGRTSHSVLYLAFVPSQAGEPQAAVALGLPCAGAGFPVRPILFGMFAGARPWRARFWSVRGSRGMGREGRPLGPMGTPISWRSRRFSLALPDGSDEGRGLCRHIQGAGDLTWSMFPDRDAFSSGPEASDCIASTKLLRPLGSAALIRPGERAAPAL